MIVRYGHMEFNASDMHTPEGIIDILADTFPELGDGQGIYKREGDILRIFVQPMATQKYQFRQVSYENNKTTITTMKQEVNYV